MQPHKPAPAKMMLAIDKSKGRSSVPAPVAGAVPKVSYKPAASKRPAPAPTPSAKMPSSNQMRSPPPALAAAKPSKVVLKPAQMTHPPLLPKPASAAGISRSMPPKKNNEESSLSMTATSLGTIGSTSKLRISSIPEVTCDPSSDQLLLELSGIVDSIDRDEVGVPSWKIMVSDTSSNTIEVGYWPPVDEPKDRIGVGSTYRFIGRAAQSASGQPKITAIAIKESAGGEDEVIMSAIQKAVEAKKNEA